MIEQGAAVRSMASAAQPSADMQGIRGYAWVWNAPDRMNRIIPRAAVPDRAVTVPLLAYHDDEQAIGQAVLGPPDDMGLPYVATFAKGNARVEEIKGLVRDGGIPAVSISWLAIEPPQYDGDPWDWDATVTFPKIDLLELSVCPVPANPLVTMQAASLMGKMNAGEIADLLTLPSRQEARAQFVRERAEAAAMTESPVGSLVALCGQLDDAIDNLLASLDRDDPALTRSLATVADTLCDKLLMVVGVVDADEGAESASLPVFKRATLMPAEMAADLALEAELLEAEAAILAP